MQHEQARPIATTLQLLRPLLWVAALLALLLALLAGGVVWLLMSDSGTRWLFQRLPGVEAGGLRGALLSSRFEADRLKVSWAGGRQSVLILGLRADGLQWSWRPAGSSTTWVGLDAATLNASEVVVQTGPPSGEPLALPATLASPLRLRVQDLAVDTLRIDTLAPLQGLRARVALGADGRHSLDGVQLAWDRLALQGRLQIAEQTPFALAGELQARPRLDSDTTFAATLKAGGTLARIDAQATVRGSARDGHAAPSADLSAALTPFAPWPLARLSGQTAALDLAALASALPQTQLSGRVQVNSSAIDAPIAASVQLDNGLPGRWNEGRLPLRSLALELNGNARQRNLLELTQFDARLPAGRWQGQGRWLDHRLELKTVLSDVQPQQMDGRAPAVSLSGPLEFQHVGLPSPDPADTSTPPARLSTLRTTLEGRMDTAPQPVKLTLDASLEPGRLELRQLRAQAGAALAEAKASAERNAAGALQLSTSGSLTDFDPVPWWPGEAGSAWRQGPHRLSGSWQLDLRAPAGALQLAPLALLPRLAGSGTLRLTESQLAGVPLSGELALAQTPTSATPSSLKGELRAGSNRLLITGQGNPLGEGLSDSLRLELQADSLAGLAPLLRLEPALAAWAPRAGSASATLTAQGRWPALNTEGQATVQQLQAAALTLASAEAHWHFNTGGQAQQPLEAQAQLAGLRWGTQKVEQLRGELRGTWREHQLLVTAALPLQPPPVAEQLLALRPGAGTRAQLQAEGSWQPEPAGGGRWQGRVARLAVGSWDGKTIAGDTPADWLDARELRADLQFGTQGQLERLHAEPGNVQVAGAVALRWDEILVQPREQGALIDLRAEIAPFPVAPLLARAQPTMGWGGDLKLSAKVQVRAAEKFDADIVVERADGDLTLHDDAGLQLLGLTDLRLALAAHDGQWIFTQGLAGRTLGEMAGALSVKTTPQQRWPGPEAPLEGVLEARVANLGVWGVWVPPGWRLGGELRTSATVGGRFGAPEYTGQVSGKELSVRNLLQGVNISQGTVAIKLGGTAASIEQFSFKGGDGTLKLSGGAEFGATPTARLKLVAERFRLLGRIDRQIVTSGSAEALLQRDLVQVDGRFGVDEGLFDASRGDAPSLDDDVKVRRAADRREAEEAAVLPKPRRNVAVTLAVDLGEQLRVRGHGLDTALRGQLRITTPGGRLQVAGTVSTEGGTYAAYGQKLAIERGILAFSGAPENPRLDILALRPNIDQRVGVSITGNTDSPRVRLYSETDMSDTDRLSWLVLGRAPDGLGRTDTALLQRAAVALLSGEGEAPTDALMKSLGIDDIGVSQRESGDVRETVVTLGKQLSRRWYVGYERGVNTTTGTWQLIYRIAQRFTLRAQSGAENSLDVIWVWKFDEVPLPAAMTKSPPTPP